MIPKRNLGHQEWRKRKMVNRIEYLSPLKFFKICMTIESKNYNTVQWISGAHRCDTHDNYKMKGEGKGTYRVVRFLHVTWTGKILNIYYNPWRNHWKQLFKTMQRDIVKSSTDKLEYKILKMLT